MPLDQPAESQDQATVTLAERLARHQLSERHRPLSQIAAEAGFADQSHFTRTFKRFTGLTPRQYRTFLAFKIR